MIRTEDYPLEVNISGQDKKSLIIIPGFGLSGDVWKETFSKLENAFKFYNLNIQDMQALRKSQT